MIPTIEFSEPADPPRGCARWLPAAIIACSCVWGLSSFGFHDNLEGLNADVALEMLQRGDPILPRLDGVPYLEKPPLLYWLIASSFRLFGPSEASARLVPLMAAMATLGLLGYWIARRGGPWLAWLTCLAFATSAGILVMTRMATFELPLTFLMTASAAALYESVRRGGKGASLLAGLALGAGVMTKGLLAALLPIGAVAAYALLSANAGVLRRPRWSLMAATFAAVAVPWHVLVSLRRGDFSEFYFVNEHLFRFLGRRDPPDYLTGPVWYYVPNALALILPWSFLVPAAMVAGWRAIRRLRQSSEAGERDHLIAYALAGFAVAFLFFSLSRAKANYYLVPALPLLCILVAEAGRQALVGGKEKLPALAYVIPAVGQAIVVAILIGTAMNLSPNYPIRLDAAFWARLAPSLLVAGVVLLPVSGMPKRLRWTAALAPTCAAAILIHVQVLQLREAEISSRPLAQAVKEARVGAEPVAIYSRFERFSSLGFYLGDRIAEIDGGGGDLEWGRRWEDDRDFFVAMKDLRAWAGRHPSALLVSTAQGIERTRAALAGVATVESLKEFPARHRTSCRFLCRIRSVERP